MAFNSSGGVGAVNLVWSDGCTLTTPPTGGVAVGSSGTVTGMRVVSSPGTTDNLNLQAAMDADESARPADHHDAGCP